MKKTLLTTALLMSMGAQAADTPSNQEARQLVKAYMGELKPALKKGMKNGGPVNAIDVCHTQAPAIAEALSEKSGWHINRVSLKPRGETAQPDAWEEEVLEKFNQKLAEGANPKKIEFSQTVIVNGEKQYRYMKAIPTGGICLACHGTDVKAPVKEAIDQHYPNDQAMGYQKGQLRGAFSFTKSL